MVAKWLGQPLMPWQQMVADVAGELVEHPERPGLMVPAYREVVVTVPRQNGKTTLVLSFQIDRAVGFDQPERIIYSAQTGQDARSKLLEDQVPMMEASPAVARFIKKVNRSKGEESVEFVTGSRLSLMASSKGSGHGKTTVGLAVVDEAFDDVDDYREQAMTPSQLTVPDAQMMVLSTQGTEESLYLNRKTTNGRIAATDDAGFGTAYFEWSASETDDPDDPATWWGCMPALGHTIDERTVKAMRDSMRDSDFRRAGLNISDRHSEDRPIPSVVWDRVKSAAAMPAGGLVLGVDMAPERNHGSLVMCDGLGDVELIDSQGGVTWVLPRVIELLGAHDAQLALDKRSPAASLIAPLEAAGFGKRIRAYSLEEMASAAGRLQDAVADERIRVRPDHRLDEAVAHAVRRYSGDVWVWGRKSALADVTALVAMTVAYDAAVLPASGLEELSGGLMA